MALLCAALFLQGWTYAGEFEDGVVAYEKKNYAVAMEKFKVAAAQNDAYALYNLAHMHVNGHGVIQDYAEALKWYKLAAAQGHGDARVNIGYMYGKGQGVAQDYVRAHMWFNLAAAQGGKNAVSNRDAVAVKMTAPQITEAQKLARECQARKYKNCE